MSGIMSELAEWGSFYAIVGSAAGALIGLQFVVMTLVAERPPIRAADAGAAFATPTIIHFCAALLLSALLRAPWQTITIAAALWGLMGFCGIAYAVIVARRMRKQAAYQPQFEDWLFHVVLPLAAYAILALSPFTAPSRTRESLFGVGAAALLLLFVGIHNSWDAVAYHVFVNKPDADAERRQDGTSGKKMP
jgi:L-asparagine transporter-like permease